jgi:hypothetical protein
MFYEERLLSVMRAAESANFGVRICSNHYVVTDLDFPETEMYIPTKTTTDNRGDALLHNLSIMVSDKIILERRRRTADVLAKAKLIPEELRVLRYITNEQEET